MRQFTLGSFAVLALVALAIRLAGGQPATWLHPAFFWLCFTVGVPAAALHAVWTRAELRRALSQAWWAEAGDRGVATSASIWRAAEGVAYLSGLLGCVSGLMITFTFLDRGGLGFKIAASLTPLFFGLVSALLFRLLRLRVEHLQVPAGP